MAKVVNPDFFKKESKPAATKKASVKPAKKEEVFENHDIIPLTVSSRLLASLKETAKTLSEYKRSEAANEIEQIYKRATRKRFSVAVIGEFSRGKSTFLNNFFGKEFLPVGNLPTTALLTRIRYAKQERLLHFDTAGKNDAQRALKMSSWEGLTAENFGYEDPTGFVVANVDDPWIGKNNIEFIDTPGAGDLEEKRAQAIGNALLGCDGAIITISAASPLSMSEKIFIEQRLIARKTPFMMLILTKLDTIDEKERANVISFVKDKLSSWHMDNIPVFVPYNVETEGNKYKDIMGMDRIKSQILSWIKDPERVNMTEEWIAAQAINVIEKELYFLSEQNNLLSMDVEKREQIIKDKRENLENTDEQWEDLREELSRRSHSCYQKLMNKVDEYVQTITERLQFEVSHSSDPEKWWKEDYSYRLKIELTNMSVGIENLTSKLISDDIRWFNSAVEKKFHTHFSFEKDTVSDRSMLATPVSSKNIVFEDIAKKRNAMRIGTAVLSIAGWSLFSSIGFLPIVATLGVGTGSTIFSEKMFKKKLDEQRDLLKKTIATEVPRVVMESTEQSELKLKSIYDDILESAKETEKDWKNIQLKAIESSALPEKEKVSTRKDMIEKQINELTRLSISLSI